MDPLKQAMLDLYEKIRVETDYSATRFLQMLRSESSGETIARALILGVEKRYGFEALADLDRLDLTVEAMVVEDQKWHGVLGREVIGAAKWQLEQKGYVSKNRQE